MDAREGGSVARTFYDDDLERSFLRDGFVIVDLAGSETVEALLTFFRGIDSGIQEGYYPSMMSRDRSYKARTHEEVQRLLWPLVSQYLDRYEPLLGVFMVKHPGPGTEVAPHQDWIVADESQRPTMDVWMPLTEVTPEAGMMRVLPGSHRWLEGLRGSPGFPTQWAADYERVRDELMVPLDIGVGQAMVYDIRLLHGTPANHSADTRVATSIYAIPEGEQPIHYYRRPDGTAVGYRVPEDFFVTFDIGDVPEAETFTEIPAYEVEELTFDQMAERYASERRAVGLGA